MTARMVVVDDDRALLALLDTLLTEAGYHPILWDQAQDAHELIRTVPQLVRTHLDRLGLGADLTTMVKGPSTVLRLPPPGSGSVTT
jgi:DNA-binding response OmpR family regulator